MKKRRRSDSSEHPSKRTEAQEDSNPLELGLPIPETFSKEAVAKALAEQEEEEREKASKVPQVWPVGD